MMTPRLFHHLFQRLSNLLVILCDSKLTSTSVFLGLALALCACPRSPELTTPLRPQPGLDIQVEITDPSKLVIAFGSERLPEALEVALYEIAVTTEGEVEVKRAQVKRFQNPFADQDVLTFSLAANAYHQLSVDPVDRITGYPKPSETYLPDGVTLSDSRQWQARWTLRERGTGIWVRTYENQAPDIYVDVSQIDDFLQR